MHGKNIDKHIWIVFHISIPLLLAFSVFISPVKINTQLMDMLPQSAHSKAAAEADRILSGKNGREAVILAASSDFETAKKGASMLYDDFKNSQKTETISFYFDSSVMKEFSDYLFNYRFVIAEKETLQLLEEGSSQEIAWDALASAYGAFNILSLDNIEKDPFLLSQRRMQSFLSSSLLSGGLSLTDDVLAAEIDGRWYVLLRMTLAPDAVSISGGKNAVKEIYERCASIKQSISGLDFYFSGVPFHSYESSSGAQREITIITSVALTLILLLFLYIFRSPLPVILSVTDVLISLGIATAAALLVFREVHILTFVFGTALIGTCVDYSIHFFIHWKGNINLKDGYEIRSHIKKSILVCFISTEICFFAFLLAPFPILKQFAVFSMAGLLSSFLTAYCIFPCLKVPQDDKRNLKILSLKIFDRIKNVGLTPVFRYVFLCVFALSCLAVIFFHPNRMTIKNDVSSLYTMSPALLESEKIAAVALDQNSSFFYYIVSGATAQQTLQNEEKLIKRLDGLASVMGTSVFVPSIESQKKTYELMRELLPLAQSQYEYLGFPSEYAQTYYDEFNSSLNYCLPENAPSNMGVSNLWIGKAGDAYYSCVLPVNAADSELFRSVASEFDFVHFISKAQDISRDLDTLTATIMIFFLAAFIIVSILIFFLYPKKESLKICIVPVFLVLAALAVLTLNKIPLGFFSVAGLIMVFGLGLDFIIYMTGRKFLDADRLSLLTPLAVLLSFLTSLLSFGALSLSNFVPVHIFGLTVSAGLTAAFISTIFLTKTSRRDAENLF